MDNPPQDTGHASKARERQQRRRTRQQTQTTAAVSAARRQSRQLAPPRRYELPNIRIPFLRQILLAIAGGIFMVVLIILVGMFKSKPVAAKPNAIWISEDWTYDERSDEDMNGLIAHLRENNIGTVYAWVSYLKVDGLWSGVPERNNTFTEVEAQVQAFTEQFHRLYPEAELFAWVQFPVSMGDRPYRLDDQGLQQVMASFCLDLVTRYGFDGILVDVTPVPDGDQNFLALLQRIRSTLSDDARIAVYVPPDWNPPGDDAPAPQVIADGTIWEQTYKQRVALIADQLVVQTYNSYLESTEDYEAWVAYQVATYAEAVGSLNAETDIIIGVPTYADEAGHDTSVENINTALAGIRRGLTQAGEYSSTIEGLGIYAAWETDDEEWDTFRELWANR